MTSGASAPRWQGGGRSRYWRFVTTSPTTPPAGMRGVASRRGVYQQALSAKGAAVGGFCRKLVHNVFKPPGTR